MTVGYRSPSSRDLRYLDNEHLSDDVTNTDAVHSNTPDNIMTTIMLISNDRTAKLQS